MTATGWQGSEPGGEPSFDLAMRGYDRRQVDERLAHLGAELAATDDALQQSRMHTSELSEQLRIAVDRLRQSGAGARQKDSFGFRVEKILRLAEEEAKELRAQATADATAIVERARAEASACLEESERVLAEAYREAERTKAQAHTHAATLAAQVEADLAGRQRAAERELSRLATVRDQVRTELGRVRDQLRSALPLWPDELSAVGPVGGAGPAAGASFTTDAAPGAAKPANPVQPTPGTPAHRRHGADDDPVESVTQPVVPAQLAGERVSRHRQPSRQAPATGRVGGIG